MLETNLAILKGILAEEYGLPPNAIQPEMFDFLKVVAMGAKKYAMNNWLDPDGHSSSETAMHDKINHHVARSYASTKTKVDRNDPESGVDHLLSAMCRAGMAYTRRQRGIIHPEDM